MSTIIVDFIKKSTTNVDYHQRHSAFIHMIRFRLTELIADKAFKERRVISLMEVAEATGIHRATLSKMANQPGANIGTEIVDRLCDYFGCSVGDLMTHLSAKDEIAP